MRATRAPAVVAGNRATCSRLAPSSRFTRKVLGSTAMVDSPTTPQQKALGPAAVMDRKLLYQSNFLQFFDIEYKRSEDDKTRRWQCVNRKSSGSDHGVDAVAVFAVLRFKGEEPKVMIVKQFRPPLGTYAVELCAGLMMEGEAPEGAALRIIEQETGYVGEITGISGKQYQSPGLTNERITTVYLHIDAETIRFYPDEDKHIEIDYLPLKGLYKELNKLEQQGYCVWTGLHALAQGMQLRDLVGEF